MTEEDAGMTKEDGAKILCATRRIRMKKLPVSAYIITRNEEKNIRRCLDSVKGFDEIVVVDSFSEDGTVSICEEYTDKIHQRAWPGFKEQFSYALSLTKNDWVFSLDADEVATPELLSEIGEVFERGAGDVEGYHISRMSYYMGRWIRHGSWSPDHKLRLFKKEKARYTGQDPHPKVEVGGKTKRLEGKIHHYSLESFSHHLRTIDRYADVRADRKKGGWTKLCLPLMLFHPVLSFLKGYIIKAGFLDGIEGLIIAATSSFAVFARYVKLWERKSTRR